MYTIGKFANLIGKTVQTLRDWDKKGILKPEYRTQGGHRMYGENQLNSVLQRKSNPERINIGYARVSSKHQEDELVEDILNIIHGFSCKLKGKKSHINKK